jgi:hypothetical protein
MPKSRKGPNGPKRRAGGQRGTNRFARAPKGSSGSPGGKMHKSLVGKG